MAEAWGYTAPPADVFSAGVCLFILAWQCPPWQSARLADRMFAYVHTRGERGLAGLLQHWSKPPLCPEAMQLLAEVLRSDPAKRPSAATCLASPWFAAMEDTCASVHAQPHPAGATQPGHLPAAALSGGA